MQEINLPSGKYLAVTVPEGVYDYEIMIGYDEQKSNLLCILRPDESIKPNLPDITHK